MKTHVNFLALVGVLFALGCSGTSEAPDAAARRIAAVDGSKYLLAEEPEDALGVIDARESAEDGAPITVVGRIGGSANPWVEGRAAFMLLDASMLVVAEGEEGAADELCLGDCCADQRAGCTTLVKVVDAEGRVLPADSRQLFGLAESDAVVVVGKAQKDQNGNVVVLASGVYVRR